MKCPQFIDKALEILKKNVWYLFLLLISSIYIFINRNDIYQLTKLNVHNLIFILWLVLLILPLFSEIEIGSVKLKKELEKTRTEVKESIQELKLQILDIKIANSNTFVVNNQPLPSKDELSQLQKNIEYNNSNISSENLDFNIIAYKKSGRVETLSVGGKNYSGREVREKLGLPSSCFTIDYANGKYTFTTKGSGHGVGMSQYGAQAMALDGASYKDILNHYYTGIEIVNN